jgi:hypothetical protein
VSDGFLSRSCGDVTLSLDEVDEDEDRFLSVGPASGRDRKNREARTRLIQELRALWIVRKVELWIVVPGFDRERSG